MMEKNIRKVIAFSMIAGALMQIFEHPYGSLVFTIGFGAYLLMKLFKLFELRVRFWTSLHFVQLSLILIAGAALLFKYYEYPYSTAILAVSLLTEALISVKIKLNTMFGSSNVNAFFRMIKKFLLASRMPAEKPRIIHLD